MNSKIAFNMNSINRRNFITQTLVLLSSSLTAGSVNSNSLIELESLNTSIEFQHECFLIYEEWKKREQLEPLVFLHDAINKRNIKISELTKIDFQNQIFFPIEGLLLGKTEAAFLALLGSNVTF